MPIKILESRVVSRIAAGEVVQRPASAVKELVENSLDAGATQISVEVAGGGVGLLRVTDNGGGIPAGELELAFQRYATSKIAGLDDIESISSLGFRGEALPSIAAVSRMEALTCAAGDAVGSYICLKEGVILPGAEGRRSQARARGTTITVRDLLRNVPARLKFLKSPAAEASHIARVVSQYALAYPGVKFSLSMEGRVTLQTPGNGRLADAIAEVYGPEMAREMLDLSADSYQPAATGQWQGGPAQTVRVSGMAGAPTVNRSGRDHLSLFVNGRWIENKLLGWAVEEAYHGLLMQGRHPVAVINISLNPADVDVNIHPTKTEVKFKDERLVFGAVQRAVRRALIAQAPVPGIEEVAAPYAAPSQPMTSFWMPPETSHQTTGYSPPPHQTPGPAAESFPPRGQTPALSLPALRLLGQLASSYIVAEGPAGLYLIDQHAAHERILFELIQTQSARRQMEVQGLLQPATLEVTPGQDERLKSCYPELAEFGFSIEPFGERSYLVRAVPWLLHKKDWAAALRELLDELTSGNASDWREAISTSFACHGAIKAGQPLADDEMRELLRQLEQAALPNSCPHGRPTMIRLSTSQLEREFKRT